MGRLERLNKSIISESGTPQGFISVVPAVGIEPTCPQGTRDFESNLELRRFPIKIKQLGFEQLEGHLGIAWVILDYFRLGRLHF